MNLNDTPLFEEAELHNQEVEVVSNMAALCVMKSLRTALSAVHCVINNSLTPRLLNAPQLSFFGCTSSRGIRQGKFYLACPVRCQTESHATQVYILCFVYDKELNVLSAFIFL